jgi:hypothetical protein
MGRSKHDSPEPTDPRETSAASTATGVSTALANAYLQNMNEVTPDGTRTFNKTGSESVFDLYTGQSYDVPRFTVETTLSPEQQAIKGQTDAAELNLASLANNQSGFLNDYMAQPFSYDPGQHENWALGLYEDLNSGKVDDSREALRSQLANQGIAMGSEAYDRAMGNFDTSQMDSRNRFLLDSYNTGLQTAKVERDQPLNEISALLSGSQVAMPNFASGVGVNAIPTTDNASIIANYDNAVMNQWQQNQAATGTTLSGLGGLFKGIGAISSLSDIRAKEDVRKIAETADGLGIYSFRYKGSPKTEIGLIAQEVQAVKPQAVHERPDGFLAVDYGEALA